MTWSKVLLLMWNTREMPDSRCSFSTSPTSRSPKWRRHVVSSSSNSYRKRRCILPVDQQHWGEVDSLFAPQVAHNLPQPANVGGAAWAQHDTHGLDAALRAFAPLMNPL